MIIITQQGLMDPPVQDQRRTVLRMKRQYHIRGVCIRWRKLEPIPSQYEGQRHFRF